MAKSVISAQRKDRDGQYAAEHGIKVPYIFPSYAEAQAYASKGGMVIARTEHPSELDGVSGVNHSHVIAPEYASSSEFYDLFCNDDEVDFIAASRKWHEAFFHVKSYCELRGLSVRTYVMNLGHSYWEFITGVNIFVVGDPVLPGRLRLFASWPEDIWTYSIFDGTEFVAGYASEQLQSHIDGIVQMYRQVQQVFGEQCCVVEMQLAENGEVYFLQRSNGRPTQNVNWRFEEESDSHLVLGRGYGEVLGSTPEEGVEVDILLERSARYESLTKDKPSAVLCSHISNVVIEQDTVARSAAYILVKKYLSHGPGGHSSVIPLAKSPLHLFAPGLVDHLPPELRDSISELEEQKLNAAGRVRRSAGAVEIANMARDFYTNPDYMVRLRLNIRSDGREARITVLDMS